MTTLIINLFGSTENSVDEYEEDESGLSCPVPTRNAEVNEENMESAVAEANYHDATNDGGFVLSENCGNCASYNLMDSILECIGDESGESGYCQLFKFVCHAEFTCDKWSSGGPLRTIVESGSRDVF